jgi:hypothetical protein
MPGSMTTNFLAAHKQIQQSAGAIIGTTGRLPDTKTLKFLVDHRQYDSQIADYIKKYHQLPDKKHMTIIVNTVQAEHNLVKAQQHVGQLQRNLHQVGRIRTDMKVNTSLFDRNIAKAKHNITSLDGLVTKPHTKNYNITWHPSIGKAASQASGLGASLDAGVAAGITSNTAVMNSAMSAAVASAIAAGVKAAGAHSPSKVAEKKIGDPIIQGIIQGIGKGKGALNSAMQSAVGNMISQFNTLKDTFQGQLGDLFTGVDKFGQSDLQQKIDWGEKLNISDLMKNVRLQNHTFGQFEHNLNRLQRRRGVTRPFVEMLRQLGPAAEPEVEAMLRATPKQIRKYVKMWEQGQKMVNNTAKKSMSNTMKIWKKQGEAVAFGFMSGMEAHSAQMARFFERMFMNLYRHVKHVHKSHSPSKLYFEEGVNVMQGFALGVEHGASRSNVTRHFSPVGRYHHRGPLVAPVTNNYYYNKTYNVYPQKNENLLSALRKHDHVTRNRP